MHGNHVRGATSSVLALITSWAAVIGLPDVASAQEVPRREAVIVDESGSPSSGGGSRTPFSLRLPDGAACQGDSANDGYRVDSYLLPLSTDPIDVTFTGAGPEPHGHGEYEVFRQPLFEPTSASYAAAMTAEQVAPGEPGPIINIPLFDLAVFGEKPGALPAGEYRIGLACTLTGEVDSLWETRIEITEDPTDEPAGIAWAPTGGQDLAAIGASASGDGFPLVPALVGIGAVAATAAVVLNRKARAERGVATPAEALR